MNVAFSYKKPKDRTATMWHPIEILKLKRNTGAILVVLMGCYCAHAVATTEVPPVSGYSNGAAWRIKDRWVFIIEHPCNTEETNYGFWPTDAVCTGKLYMGRVANLEDDPDNDFWIERRNRSLEVIAALNNLRTAISGNSGGISVNGIDGTSMDVYTQVLALKDPVVSFAGQSYRLKALNELATKDMSVQLDKAKKVIEEKRTRLVLSLLSIGALIIFSLLTLRWVAKRLLPRLARVTEKISDVGTSKSKEALSGLRHMHMRHIAMDESIRAATRKSLDITQKERTELRAQISQALDSGNSELAKTLMSLLKKLEGDGA